MTGSEHLMKTANISAIILAAGMSSRMGELKPLMPLGETTVIEHIVRMFRAAGVGDICVMAGCRVEEVATALPSLEVRLVVNESWASGMFSSIKTGIENLGANCDAFFILPVDIPLVRPGTINALLAAYQPGLIIHPIFQGRRGHPPLISSYFRQKILNYNGAGGLRSFMGQNELFAVDLAVADRGILSDMDTPRDYQKIVSSYQRRQIPTADECMVLMTDVLRVEKKIVDHCQTVAKVALNLGEEINRAGCGLDLELIVAAGLLHDLARDQSDHAAVAEQILRELGYPEVAAVVGAHMDLSLEGGESIREKEIVYLADKLVSGSRIVTLQSRFGDKSKKYAADPDALQSIGRRLDTAMKIKSRLEQSTGRSLESIVAQSDYRIEQ